MNHNYKVQKVIVPQNLSSTQQDIVYAIARNSFLKSTTGGNTWATVYSLGTYVGEAVDMEVAPTDYNKIFIGTNCISHYQESTHSNVFDYPAKLFYTNDGGSTWNDITTNISGAVNYSSIHLEIILNGTLYVHYSIWGGSTLLKKSTDNGLTWTTVPVTARGLYGNESFKVSSQTGIIYQGSHIAYKDNSSMYNYAATATTHCDIRAIQVIPTTSDDIIILANDGGVSKSIDGGTTWSSLNGNGKTGLINSEIHGFAISNMHEDRVLVGRQDNGTSLMFNNEWQNQNIFQGDGEECLFKPDNYNYFYSVNNCEIRKGKIVNGYATQQTFSSDPGVNCYTYASTDKFLGRPIAMHKQFPDRMFAGKKGGKLNITSDDGVTWTTVQLKESDGVTNVNASIIDIEIAPSHPNIMYVVTNQIMWGSSSGAKNAVFRSSDFGQNWTDITSGITQSVPNYWIAVTDLTIDYVNPNKVWISMGSVNMDASGDAKLRVLRCDNTNAGNNSRDWIDMTTNNISPLPVTTIVNQPNTDRVFIGTDAGVFYYEDNDWHCFSFGLPITWIKDMKINHQTSELYIGTYGNGLWKSPLPCIAGVAGAVLEVTSDITIQNDLNHMSDVIVKNNSTLTFTNSAIITMGDNHKIIVEPGSKLIIDNATVTSGCGSYWKGIEVWGNYNMTQSATNQGVVQVINGGTIRNAETAIRTIKVNTDGSLDWSKTGGIVQLDGAKFINNNYGVWIGGYRSYFNKTLRGNVSYIKNSHFEFNNNMLDGHTGFTHIGLYSIGRLNIAGNDFINTRLDKDKLSTEKRGMGIISYDANFNVSPLCLSQTTPCSSEKPNYFNGLNYGVIVCNGNSDASTTISKCVFRNVYRSILLSGTNQAVVTLNDIKVPNKDNAYSLPENITTTETDKEPYGLYLYESTAFTVEENHFRAVDKLYAKTSNTNGIIINNTFDNVNELYKNYFDTLQYAIVAMNQNREDAIGGQPFKGLEFLCNNMNDCFSDIDVTSNADNTGLIGVAKHQGLSYFYQGHNIHLSAENLFSWDGYKPASDFDNSNGKNSIIYYHSPGQDKNQNSSSTDYWVPTYWSNIIPTPVSRQGVTLCESKINTGDNLNSDYIALTNAKVALNSSKLTLAIWKNGGIDDLGEQVENTSNPEAYQQFNALMNKSPYLSDEVLLEAIDNPVFTALMIKLIMIANPHSSHNDEIMSALENRVPAMPQNYIDEIRAGENTVSQLEHLQAYVAFDYHLYKTIADDITRIYRTDVEDGWATDSLIAFLSRMDDVNSQYELAMVYFNCKQFEDMNNTLTAIGNRVDLSDNQNNNHANYLSYFGIISSLSQEGKNIDELTETQKTTLTAMANSEDHFFSAYALAKLKANNKEYAFAETIKHSPVTSSRIAYKGNEDIDAQAKSALKVFPNPTNDYITVEYRTDGQYNLLSIGLYDITGKLIRKNQLNNSSNDLLMNLTNIKPGVYMLRLMGDGSIIESKRITIIE